jgi:hypothetical protein
MISKLINKIKLFFIIKYNESIFNKELDSSMNMWFNQEDMDILQQEETQKKYQNGIALIKTKIDAQLKSGKSFHEVLSQYRDRDTFHLDPDLLALALDESEKEKLLRETLESIIVFKEKDIKSDKDLDKMLSTKVNNYNEFLRKKKMRELLRAGRKAKSDGDLELYKQLQKEYRNLNGTRFN